MLSVLHTVFAWVFVVLWGGGNILLFVRFRAAQAVYLKQFDSVDGVPLDSYPPYPPGMLAAIWEAMLEWQFDPALETQRRKMWARYGWMAAWMFGFPITLATIAVVLIVTGHGAWLLG